MDETELYRIERWVERIERHRKRRSDRDNGVAGLLLRHVSALAFEVRRQQALLAEWEPYVDTRELDIDVPGGLDRYERAVADLRQRAGTPTPRPARVVRQAEGE